MKGDFPVEEKWGPYEKEVGVKSFCGRKRTAWPEVGVTVVAQLRSTDFTRPWKFMDNYDDGKKKRLRGTARTANAGRKTSA